MKKVLLIAASVLLTVGLQAQDTKMWLGGTAGFNSMGEKDAGDETNDVSTFSWDFGPTFGYMLNEKMGVGINLSVNGSTATKNNSTEDKTINSGYNVQPFFRYYFAGSDNFKFFGDAAVSFGGGSATFEDNTGNSNESKYGTFGVAINPGVQFWFTDNWSMTSTIGLLGYDSRTNNKDETDKNGNSQEKTVTNFGLNANFSTLKFSLLYHF